MSYKIIDNFLSKEFYDFISNELKDLKTPWYFQENDVPGVKNNGFFSFCYYNNFRPMHNMFDSHITPILNRLDVKSCIQVRANLVFRDIDTIECPYHNDNDCLYSTTAIFYLTNCNAQTILKINDKEVCIDSVENRMLLFDTNILHKVKYQTDVHKRYVINFNFIRNKNEFKS